MSSQTVTLKQMERELDRLKKKFFQYETMISEKEAKDKKVTGPFRNGKEIIKSLKK